MIVEINALDTLFFRDGKPFNMGEDTWADSTFFPFPSVIYGALRSAYFAEHMDIFQRLRQEGKLDSKDDPTKKLEIRNIALKISDEYFFPAPLDCVEDKDEKDVKDKTLSMLHLKSSDSVISNYPALGKLLIPDTGKKIENVAGAILSDIDFKNYLNAKSESFPYLKITDYIIDEPKIGIRVSHITHTSDKSRLYRVNMKRLENRNREKTSIIVDFEGLDLNDNIFIKLGGEGKAAYCRGCSKNIDIAPPKFEQGEIMFKVVLSTPAIFRNGWAPAWIDETTSEGSSNGLRLKLIAAAIGKPVNIGGFDMKKKKPKPMYRSVPASSVYYFEIIEGDISKAIAEFHQQAISDIYPEQGFGIAYVGKIGGELR